MRKSPITFPISPAALDLFYNPPIVEKEVLKLYIFTEDH